MPRLVARARTYYALVPLSLTPRPLSMRMTIMSEMEMGSMTGCRPQAVPKKVKQPKSHNRLGYQPVNPISDYR